MMGREMWVLLGARREHGRSGLSRGNVLAAP